MGARNQNPLPLKNRESSKFPSEAAKFAIQSTTTSSSCGWTLRMSASPVGEGGLFSARVPLPLRHPGPLKQGRSAPVAGRCAKPHPPNPTTQSQAAAWIFYRTISFSPWSFSNSLRQARHEKTDESLRAPGQ